MTKQVFMFDGELAPEWLWRTAGEGDIAPRDMVTRHLFFTLRMIWNNTVPSHMEVGYSIRYYRWGKRHPKHYLLEAVRHIGRELTTRTDMTPEWKRQLAQMASWFREDNFEEMFKIEPPKMVMPGG